MRRGSFSRPNARARGSSPTVNVGSGSKVAIVVPIVVALAGAPACYRGATGTGASDHDDAGGSDGSGPTDGDSGDGADTGDGVPGECRPAALDMRRLTELQYRRSIAAIFDGRVDASGAFPAPVGETPTGYSTELGAKEVSEHDVEQIVYAAEDVAVDVAAALPELLPCAADPDPDRACAEAFLGRQGRRIYRRTLTDDEREPLLDTWAAGVADGATFAEAVALVTAEMLQTPQFLYITEDAAATPRRLTGVELASRLSFLLWDSTPDDTLLDLAESGALDEQDAILDQAERLLAAPEADTTIARFFREWTSTGLVSPADKSTELFPEFDAALAASVNDGFDRFAVGIVRDGGTLDDALRSSDAWVDAGLAALFSIPAPPAGEWARVTLDPERYRGVLTQPALLASLAHSDRTSYVYRGKLVRKRLLCQTLPPPPPDAMSVPLDLPDDPTARQESETRIARGECGACHTAMDPAGLALENFDAIGRWRDTDASGRPIDPSGTLVGVGEADLTFTDHVDLVDQLAATPELGTCFARQLFRFALSRAETDADACTIAVLEGVLEDEGGDLGAALVAIVTADAFRHREAP